MELELRKDFVFVLELFISVLTNSVTSLVKNELKDLGLRRLLETE